MNNIVIRKHQTIAKTRAEQEPHNLVNHNTDSLSRPEAPLLELDFWEEFKGRCTGYNINTSHINIFIENKILVLPLDDSVITLIKDQDIDGKRIGILRTDLFDKPYLLRLLGELE